MLVTLVRAVGELSRPDLPERPGHAGWPTATPGAQSPGPFAATFAIAAHDPWSDATAAAVERLADDVLLPLVGTTTRDATVDLPIVAGIALEGDGLACSAILPTEHDGWVALRCVNVTGASVAGAWVLPAPNVEAQRARLDHTALAPLAVERAGDGARVRITVGPHAVETVLVRASLTR